MLPFTFIICFIDILLTIIYLIVEMIALHSFMNYIKFNAILLHYKLHTLTSVDPNLDITCTILNDNFNMNKTYVIYYEPNTYYNCITENKWNSEIHNIQFNIIIITILLIIGIFGCIILFCRIFQNNNKTNNINDKYNLLIV